MQFGKGKPVYIGSAEKARHNEYMQKCAVSYTKKLYNVGK